MSDYSPIILIGMHRSGTSLLAKQLGALGLFIGVHRDGNDESVYFQELNKWMFRQSGARWDNPAFVDYLLADDHARGWAKDYLALRCRAIAVRDYTGWAQFLRRGGVHPSWSRRWGWKDPRNTYTLPLWLDVFPQAKVIYIERHGVDVAHSLAAREKRLRHFSEARYQRLRPVFHFLPKAQGFVSSFRSQTLEGGLSLWADYVARGRSHVEALGPTRCLSLQYEDLLKSPKDVLAQAAAFCDLNASAEQVGRVAEGVNADRAYAFRQKAELAAFARSNADTLAMAGYEP